MLLTVLLVCCSRFLLNLFCSCPLHFTVPDHTAVHGSVIGTILVCLSVCLSVCPSACLWHCALWLNDTSYYGNYHPDPEQKCQNKVNRKCPLGTRLYNFLSTPYTDPIPLNSPTTRTMGVSTYATVPVRCDASAGHLAYILDNRRKLYVQK